MGDARAIHNDGTANFDGDGSTNTVTSWNILGDGQSLLPVGFASFATIKMIAGDQANEITVRGYVNENDTSPTQLAQETVTLSTTSLVLDNVNVMRSPVCLLFRLSRRSFLLWFDAKNVG